MVMKFKLNILRLLLREFIESRGITAVFLTVSKTFHVGIHLYTDWFKLDMMIEIIELYILLWIFVIFTLI